MAVRLDSMRKAGQKTIGQHLAPNREIEGGLILRFSKFRCFKHRCHVPSYTPPKPEASASVKTAAREGCLHYNSLRHFAADIGQSEITALVTVSQALVVYAAQIEHRGVKIVNVHLLIVLDIAVAQFVRLAPG